MEVYKYWFFIIGCPDRDEREKTERSSTLLFHLSLQFEFIFELYQLDLDYHVLGSVVRSPNCSVLLSVMAL